MKIESVMVPKAVDFFLRLGERTDAVVALIRAVDGDDNEDIAEFVRKNKSRDGIGLSETGIDIVADWASNATSTALLALVQGWEVEA